MHNQVNHEIDEIDYYYVLGCTYLVSKTGISIRNLDSLNITSLKFRDELLHNLFWGVSFGVVGLYLSISIGLLFLSSLAIVSADLIFFSLLFDALELISFSKLSV